jgi:hypothetical protein
MVGPRVEIVAAALAAVVATARAAILGVADVGEQGTPL